MAVSSWAWAAGTLNSGASIFFDAAQSFFDRANDRQVLEGDVVAISGGTLVAADKVAYTRATETLEATGHVLVLAENQVFAADTLVSQQKTGEFTLTRAIMTSHDPQTSEAIL